MIPVAYVLSCSRQSAARGDAAGIANAIRGACATAGIGLDGGPFVARRDYSLPIVGERSTFVVTVGLTGNPRLDGPFLVRLDSIVFGAIKASCRAGWSVDEIRHRLPATGTGETTRLTGDVRDVRRYAPAQSVNPNDIPGDTLSSGVVADATEQGGVGSPVNSAVSRITTETARTLSNAASDYKVPLIIAGVGIGAVAVAYVWRSFK